MQKSKVQRFWISKNDRKKMIQAGFTLIELLIVIAIIGILASLVMANLMGVRERARDAQRKSDVEQIRSALELLKADNDTYPTKPQYDAWGCNSAMSFGTPAKQYMASMPCDPKDKTKYTYSITGTTYTLTACIENNKDTGPHVTSVGSCSSGKGYVEQSP